MNHPGPSSGQFGFGLVHYSRCLLEVALEPKSITCGRKGRPSKPILRLTRPQARALTAHTTFLSSVLPFSTCCEWMKEM